MEHWEELAPGGLRLLWDDALFPPGTDSFLLSALAGSMGLLLYARRRLGGVTGDVFGCTVECTEWLVLLTFCTL